MTISLGAGRRLVLAGLEQGWLWATLGVLVLGLVVVLYRYERRLVTRRAGLTLLGLRVLAALALIAALFEPVAERVRRETLRGRVVLGVDLSDSMATMDPGRSPAEREALARLLQLSPAVDPVTLARREVARRILTGPWLPKIEAAHDVAAVGFARRAQAASPEALAKALARPAAAGSLEGRTTDWEPVLEQGVATGDGRPVVGVVLLTDGRGNGPPPSRSALSRLKEQGVPVFPVVIGSTAPPRDVAIAAVQAPETADKGQVARVDVTVKADGLPPGTEVPVTLERPGQPPLKQTVRAQAGGGRPVVSFRVPMAEPGEVAMALAIGPVARDVRPDNDRRTVKVTVTDDQARVLLVDAEPRWEFQYLRNALVRDPRVTLEAVVLNQPRLPDRADTTYALELPKLPEPPADPKDPPLPDPLGAFDLIALGDLRPGDLTPADWERLERYVARRGGTLVLSSGPRGGADVAGGLDTIRALLPVQDLRLLPVDPTATDPTRPALPAGAALAPTETAAAGPWPMLQFADSVAASQAAWSGLPRLPWVLAGRAKPAATVLATALTVGAIPPSGAAPAAEADTVAVAAMPYGLGKVFWVGTDATWRWRFHAGDAYHHRFWGQVVQWATRGKLEAGNRLVQFGPDPPRVVEDSPARIRARFADDARGVEPGLMVAARVLKAPEKPDAPPGETVALVPLRPRPDEPRVFESQAPVLPPGRYVVRLDVPDLADALKAEGGEVTAALEVTPRETPEAIDLAADRGLVERLAAETGGTVLADTEIDRLPALLQGRAVVRTRIEPTRLWDRPEALLLFLGLVTTEWIVRKRAGLP